MQESQREAELSRELEKQKENKQVEEILRLEKEIEDLQRMKERQELSLNPDEPQWELLSLSFYFSLESFSLHLYFSFTSLG